MSICIVALVVLAFLGIFSTKYRRWAKEAFACVSRRVTLRPCKTDFNQKLKAKITGKLMGKSPRLARFAHKKFELISWIFVAMLFLSIAYTAYGAYNLVNYGSCDPHSTSCIFNPGVQTCGSAHCLEFGCECETMGCDAPGFAACGGTCDCQKNTCG